MRDFVERMDTANFTERPKDEPTQQSILSRIRSDDLRREREKYSALFHRGDDGRIPPDAYSRAAERLHELRGQAPPRRGRVGGLSVGAKLQPAPPFVVELLAGLAPDNSGWKSLGPGNIGGRIGSILINPNNTLNIYIGSLGGGVWITTDGGHTWQPGDDLMANLAVCSMAMVPNNPSTIYAGTGEGYNNVDAIQGNGIFKTNDGWVWEQLASTKPTPTNQNFLWVNGLAINSDGSVILAGTRTGIFRSIDGGTNWTQALSVPNVGNLLFDPADKTKAIAGMLYGGGIYYSTNGGSSWIKATNPAGTYDIGRAQVCYAAKNTNTVYASVETIDRSNVTGSAIWVSTNGGHTFAKTSSMIDYLRGQGWYDNAIWAGDPGHEDFVIVGGTDLWKSNDGGNSLTQISDWKFAPNSAHADQHIIYAQPGYDGTSNKTVFFGNDGGLYQTTDVTTVGTNPTHTDGWISLNTQLPITQFYSGSGKFTTIGTKTTVTSVVGGAQDNGTTRYLPAYGANAWNTWFAGDGGYVASDPTSANNYYGEYVYLRVFCSTDGGMRGDLICGIYGYDALGNPLWKGAPYTITDAQSGKSALFIAPFVLDPNNANCLIGGGASLWRTNNPLEPNTLGSGPTWIAIKVPVLDALVSSIAVAPGNSNLVLVGYNNGQIWKSTNATAVAPSWVRADSGINASRICTWLAIDKKDNTRFYATFGGFQLDNVWTSANSGTSWASLGAGLPPAPIYCVTIHPQNSQWLYLGTETGVFATENGGQNWSPNNEGPTNCRVNQLFWLGNTLCCATHGRGIFSIDLTIQQAKLVLTGDLIGNLTAFDAQTGAIVSNYLMPPAPGPYQTARILHAPVVDGTVVYCGYAWSPQVARFNDAYNLNAGPSWQVRMPADVLSTPCLVKAMYSGEPDVLYIVSDGKLFALDAGSGAQLWVLQLTASGRGTVQMMDQWAYCMIDRLYAVNTITRAVGWSAPFAPGRQLGAQLLLASDTVFGVSISDGCFYSIQARTGIENWRYDTGVRDSWWSTPVWVLGTIIAGVFAGDWRDRGMLVGVDYLTGKLQFSQHFWTLEDYPIDWITADGNEIYFPSNDLGGRNPSFLNAYQLNIAGATRTITKTWSVNCPTFPSKIASQVAGTSLYAVTMGPRGNGIVAINITNGTTLWQQTLQDAVTAAPTFVYG